MKVYLSVPMITNRSLDRAKAMAEAIRRGGHEVTSPWVLGPIEEQDKQMVNVFRRDKLGAEACDVLVADVSQPSIGVGMEIMASYIARRRIILVQKKGSVTSRMLHQMDRKEVLEFDDEGSLANDLARLLGE